jgi:hypothetical protein
MAYSKAMFKSCGDKASVLTTKTQMFDAHVTQFKMLLHEKQENTFLWGKII